VTAVVSPVPERVLLTRALNKARRDAEDATARAAGAYREAETARAHLTRLENEHRALTTNEGTP
jgi:ABC-type taurine transport system ATPase subunit